MTRAVSPPIVSDAEMGIERIAFLARRDGRASDVAVIGDEKARVMNHELQLVYTSTRWAETLKAGRGVFPILDVALLLRAKGDTLDWDRVCRIVDASWAATAASAMLTYLNRWQLAVVPVDVLRRLAPRGKVANRVMHDVLNRLITTFVIEGARPGAILTPSNLRIIWSTLLRDESPWANFLALAPTSHFRRTAIIDSIWGRLSSGSGPLWDRLEKEAPNSSAVNISLLVRRLPLPILCGTNSEQSHVSRLTTQDCAYIELERGIPTARPMDCFPSAHRDLSAIS